MNKRNKNKLPYVFTEQGIAMLSALLKSDIAVKVRVNIMKAFIEMRRFIFNNQMLFEKISSMELKQIEYQKMTDDRFEKVFEYIGQHQEKEQKIFFNGQVYDAFSMMVDLIKKKLDNKVCSIDINDYIWSQGRNKNIELKPYHLTRNTNY